MTFIFNNFWWDSDTESCSDTSNYQMELIEDTKLKLIKRSTSYNTFFTEDKKDKEYKINIMTKLNNILFNIDDINSKLDMYSNNVNNYKLILGSSILISMITLRIISK